MKRSPRSRSAVWLALGLFAAGRLFSADPPATGIIEGWVLNSARGEYVERARVTVEGTRLETFSDSDGSYRLVGVPVGTAGVKTFYTGLPAQRVEVAVAAGQLARLALDHRNPGDVLKSAARHRAITAATLLLLGLSGSAGAASAGPWKRHIIDNSSRGADGVRLADVNGDGHPDIATGWEHIDLDGKLDLVVTPTHAQKKPGVLWLSHDGSPFAGEWTAHELSGVDGVKYDLVALVDLDGDGDLDAITTEEVTNLGVIWYENPTRQPSRFSTHETNP